MKKLNYNSIPYIHHQFCKDLCHLTKATPIIMAYPMKAIMVARISVFDGFSLSRGIDTRCRYFKVKAVFFYVNLIHFLHLFHGMHLLTHFSYSSYSAPYSSASHFSSVFLSTIVMMPQLTKKTGIIQPLCHSRLIPVRAIHQPLYIGFLTHAYIPVVFSLFSVILSSIPDLSAPIN